MDAEGSLTTGVRQAQAQFALAHTVLTMRNNERQLKNSEVEFFRQQHFSCTRHGIVKSIVTPKQQFLVRLLDYLILKILVTCILSSCIIHLLVVVGDRDC